MSYPVRILLKDGAENQATATSEVIEMPSLPATEGDRMPEERSHLIWCSNYIKLLYNATRRRKNSSQNGLKGRRAYKLIYRL